MDGKLELETGQFSFNKENGELIGLSKSVFKKDRQLEVEVTVFHNVVL